MSFTNTSSPDEYQADQQGLKRRRHHSRFRGCLFSPEPEESMTAIELITQSKTALEARIRKMIERYREDLQSQSCFKRTTSSRAINKSRIICINTLDVQINSKEYRGLSAAQADKKLFKLFCKLFSELKYDTPERGKRAWIRRAFRGSPRLPNYMHVILDDVISGDIKLNIEDNSQIRLDVFFDILIAFLENDYRKTTAGYIINFIRDALPEIHCNYRDAVELDTGPTVRALQSHGREIFYKRIPAEDIKGILQGFRRRSSSNGAVKEVLDKSCGSDCYLEMAKICFTYIRRAFDVNPSVGSVVEDIFVEQFERAFSSYNKIDPKMLEAGRYRHSPPVSPSRSRFALSGTQTALAASNAETPRSDIFYDCYHC